jgi:hypothetical protein
LASYSKTKQIIFLPFNELRGYLHHFYPILVTKQRVLTFMTENSVTEFQMPREQKQRNENHYQFCRQGTLVSSSL